MHHRSELVLRIRNCSCKFLNNFMLVSIFAYFPKHSSLVDIINVKLGRFQAAGLIGIWDVFEGDKTNFIYEKPESLPKAMSFNHLKDIFQFLCCGLGFACVTFLIERYLLY